MSDGEKIRDVLSIIDGFLKEGEQLKKKSDDEYRNSKIFLACEMLRMVKARLED